MHLVSFRVEGNHWLPPTTLSPGDMVCVRTCDSRGAGATSCMQGFINNLGEDGCSIVVAMESRHGDPTFSKLFGKSVHIDRINGLADALTYEVPITIFIVKLDLVVKTLACDSLKCCSIELQLLFWSLFMACFWIILHSLLYTNDYRVWCFLCVMKYFCGVACLLPSQKKFTFFCSI